MKSFNSMHLDKEIIEHSQVNEKFRKEVLKDPRHAIFKEFGYELPKDMKLNIYENISDTINIVLPSDPAQLSDGLLKILSPNQEKERKDKKESFPQKEKAQIQRSPFRRPTEIPPYATERIIDGLEVEEFGTWTFGFVTKAWVYNEGNLASTIMHKTTAPTSPASYLTVEPGHNIRFEINGFGFTWRITNTTPTIEGENQISSFRIFVW